MKLLPSIIKRTKEGVSIDIERDHYILTHTDGRKIKLTDNVNEAYYWGEVDVIDTSPYQHMPDVKPETKVKEWRWVRIPKDNVEQIKDFL